MARVIPLVVALASAPSCWRLAAAEPGLVSQQVGEACLTALAAQQGRSRDEVLLALNDALALNSNADNCDLAVATASPVGIYFRAFGSWLEHPEPLYQVGVSALGICVGLACCWDGPAIWRALFTVTAAFAAAVVTFHEANLWGLAPNFVSELVLVAQAMAAVALAVHVGFEGSQVLFGVLLGLIGAYGLGDGVRSLEHAAPGVSLLWYEVGAVFGFLLYTVWRKAVLSTLAPLLGGFLVTVGTGVLLSRCCSCFANPPPVLPNADAPWLGAAASLLGHAGAHALPVHCAWALLATLVHGCFEGKIATITCLLVSIVVAAVSACTQVLCQAWPLKTQMNGSCPDWLQPAEHWQWPVFGCFVWALLTGASAWRHLDLLRDWEANNFWRSDLYDDGTVRRVTPNSMAEETFEPPGNFRTKLPGQFAPLPGAGPPGYAPGTDGRLALHPEPAAAAAHAADPISGLIAGLSDWWADVNARGRT